MRGEACNAATCFPQAHNHSRSFVISRYVAGSYRDAGDPTTRTGRARRPPKKIKTTKKKTPTAHDQKTIIPRLTPFGPSTAWILQKGFRKPLTGAGSFIHASGLLSEPSTARILQKGLRKPLIGPFFFIHAPGHLCQALTAWEPPKRALRACNGICAQGHPNDICLLCFFVFFFLLFFSAGVPWRQRPLSFNLNRHRSCCPSSSLYFSTALSKVAWDSCNTLVDLPYVLLRCPKISITALAGTVSSPSSTQTAVGVAATPASTRFSATSMILCLCSALIKAAPAFRLRTIRRLAAGKLRISIRACTMINKHIYGALSKFLSRIRTKIAFTAFFYRTPPWKFNCPNKPQKVANA